MAALLTKMLIVSSNGKFWSEDEILVSYDVTANVPLDETINILVNKAFADDWFNKIVNDRL